MYLGLGISWESLSSFFGIFSGDLLFDVLIIRPDLDATLIIGKILIQIPLGPQLGLGTQPCYPTPSDLEVK